MPNLIQVQNASKIYGGGLIKRSDATIAVDKVTFTLSDEYPTITAIAGESGSGKTTLSLLMMGQISPDAGQVLYRGRDIAKLNNEERTIMRREVQPIYQDPYAAYNPFYRVDHVLQMPIKRFRLARTKAEATRVIENSMEMVGLRPAETLGRFPHQLSGGQRQRLMVARALLCKPQVIMADEPVSMVDASLRATILASLRKLNSELGISIIYITHDLTTAYQIAENIIIMYSGCVVESGAVNQVIRSPKHPYTKLLISSIPLPDKSKKWGGQEADETQNKGRKSTGCRFANRCPVAMDICWKEKPPLYTTDPDRAVACFRYDDSPVMESLDVAAVFSRKGKAQPGATQ
ncbi:MAG: ABC transporter ATP-binding protein [Chloroflexi bacterium]|nr:ABC transporter ATP-binding protein [Chloroflexota bacterium]MCL5275214.1 ABC transporter ATP-binding protein [Chloroflexota bacterium]